MTCCFDNQGPIPESMTTMTQLEGLYLFDNFLSGYKIFYFPIHTYILTYIHTIFMCEYSYIPFRRKDPYRVERPALSKWNLLIHKQFYK